MLIKTLTLFFLLTLSMGCSHPPKNSKLGPNWNPPTKEKYVKKLRKLTKKHQEYNGLSQVFEADISFLNQDFQRMQLNLKANFMNWSEADANNQLAALKESTDKEAKFLLSFYTPDPKKNKVDKDFADWSLLLITNSGEITGKVSLFENDSDHVRVFYPTLHTWSRSYMVTFPVSTASLESQKFKFKIMGPLGMGVVEFKPL